MSKGRLGIIGCGQLSQMLGEAANRLGYRVSYLCVDETPVVEGLGSIYFPDQLDVFLAECHAITVERESLPDEMLRRAAEIGLAPNYEALVVLRERDTQKALLDQLNIPTSPWRLVETPGELDHALAALPSAHMRCKRTLGGYDGGGQWRVNSQSLNTIPGDAYPVIAEAEIAIETEYAIVIGRDQNGRTACYPMTENAMRDGILIGSYVPSGIAPEMAEQAIDYANRLVEAMNYVGVLAVEFFVTEGRLIVNEIAPRVHNTGHWTIGALGADQFTQHVGCVMGEAVRNPVFTEAAAMVNLLGDALPRRMPEGPIRTLIQTYGKGFRRGRKLGHITLIGPDATAIRAEANALIAELHDA
ncbi:MAG: ATP-grasp domain-containing protein [Luminiphilus sp.]|nr:ATP-grasp domain-containing protein [Luminiphilus sp.]